jgi:hypothetical protein
MEGSLESIEDELPVSAALETPVALSASSDESLTSPKIIQIHSIHLKTPFRSLEHLPQHPATSQPSPSMSPSSPPALSTTKTPTTSPSIQNYASIR